MKIKRINTKKILWIDTETTGLNPKVHGLREIGFILTDSGVITKEANLFISPFTYYRNVEIDDYALSISGKTIDDLEFYPASSLVFNEFIEFLERYFHDDKFIFAGFNVKFDIDFLREWFADNGAIDLFSRYFHYKALDVFALVFIFKNLGLVDTENDKLKTTCSYFNIEINAHDALSDIKATKELYELLVDKFIQRI